MRRLGGTGVLLAALAFAFAWPIQDPGWTQTAHYALVRALAEGTPKIDEYHTETGDKAYVDGHFYSVKAPGLALVSVPPYKVLDALGLVPESQRTAIWLLNLLTVVPLAILLLIAVRGPMRELTSEPAAFGIAALGAATLVLPFSTLYFSHVPTAALAVLALALALRVRSGENEERWAVLAGLAGGLAVVFEYPTALVTVAIGVYLLVVASRRARGGLAYAGGVLLGLVPLFLYNLWAFGSPFTLSYENVVRPEDRFEDVPRVVELGNAGIARPSFEVVAELLLSGRGLVTLTPVVAAGVAAVVLLYRAGRRVEAGLLGLTPLVALLWNSGFTIAYGGPFGGDSPGARYLSAVVPLVLIPLALAARRAPGAVLALAAGSLGTMALATSTKPQVGPREEGIWVDLLRAGDFTETPLTLLGLGNGWISIAPFFLALGLAAWAAWAGSGLHVSRDDYPPAAIAGGAWLVLLLACPRFLETPGGVVGAALSLALLAGACALVIAVSRSSVRAPG